MKTPQRIRVSPTNILLLTVIFMICLGTLASDDRTARPEETEVWSGDRGHFQLTVGPAPEHVDNFAADGTHTLYIELFDIAETAASGAQWRLTIEGSSEYELAGGFEFQEDGSFHEDGVKLGYLTARTGRFCKPDDPDEQNACIPCSLTDGCRINFEVDLCQQMHLSEAYFRVSIEPEDTEYEVYCGKDDDPVPCDRLSDWLTLTQESVARTLCAQ